MTSVQTSLIVAHIDCGYTGRHYFHTNFEIGDIIIVEQKDFPKQEIQKRELPIFAFKLQEVFAEVKIYTNFIPQQKISYAYMDMRTRMLLRRFNLRKQCSHYMLQKKL